jgi:hypothetical protein
MTVVRPHPARGVLASLFGLLVGLAAVLLMAVVLAPAPVAAAPPAVAGSPSLVFSEVYAPPDSDPAGQWFEIHNTQPTIRYPLNGLILATGQRRLTLETTQVITGGGYTLFVFSPDAVSRQLVRPARNAQVLAVPDLGNLNPVSDALILYSPDGQVIDQVNWGMPDPAWPNYDPDMWNPGLDMTVLATGNKDRTWGRTPADQDTNQARPPNGDWTIHEVASPGGRVPPISPTPFLNEWTNVAGALGSLLLWAAFVIIAIIAYRFQRLRDTNTYWQLLLLAPSGLLFYTIIVIIGFSQPGAALTNEQKWLSFPVLALSALFCLIAVGIFRRVARTLLEGD